MSQRKIIIEPDPILRKESEVLEKVDEKQDSSEPEIPKSEE